MNLSSLLLVSIVGVVLLKWMVSLYQYWKKYSDLPGPSEFSPPFIGNPFRKPRGKPNEFFETVTTRVREQLIDRGLQIARIWTGGIAVILVSGPDAAETLLCSSKHSEKSIFYKHMQSWLGKGLLTSNGSKWKERRRLLTPTFHFKILQDFLPVMNKQANILCTKLSKVAENGTAVNIFEDITLCTLDIICETAMGKSINAQFNATSDYVKAIYCASESIQYRQNSPWLWPDFIYKRTRVGKKYYASVDILHAFSSSVIKSRMKESARVRSKRMAFLDLLLEVAEKENVFSFPDIQEEVDTFMFEGHDTTSSGISFALQQIGTHPEVQKKLHDEIDGIFGSDIERDVTFEDLQKLNYMELVLRESLRLLPPVPFISRVTTSDCEMVGHKVPANTTCVIMLYSINHHPKYWNEPERFDPERFLPENIAKMHPFVNLPFSAGPRNCIGQKFALMEEKVVLCHILRKYNINSCQNLEDIALMGDLILRPRDGIYINLTKRESLVF